MKKIAFFFIGITLFLCSCDSSDDRIVAEIYNQKLYASEVESFLPDGLAKDDSIAFANQVIEDWITEQIILHEAEKTLSFSEKNFDKEMAEYRKSLLKSSYFEKLTADSATFYVPDEEVRKVIRQTNGTLKSEKEIVKLNYVKLSKNSPILNDLKEIMFDENRRVVEKNRIEELCADSIEYFVEKDRWLFWEDIQLEISIEIQNKEQVNVQPEYIEKCNDNYCYLIVIMGYKTEFTGEESSDYFESVRAMLIQKKKTDFINKKIDELYQKAQKSNKIVR